MKRLLTVLALVATTSVPVFAQEGPPPGPMGPPPGAAAPASPSPQQIAAMQQFRSRMEQIHLQAREQMLASLTPAHRAAVANVIGQSAVSANPNPDAVASQIDAILSQGEKNGVLSAESNARASSRSLMESMHAQMEANAPADVRARMQQRDASRGPDKNRTAERTPDAGRSLLRLAEFGHGAEPPGPGGFRGPRGM